MGKLIKRIENGSDFDVCVWLVKSGKYVVTTYDKVNKTHEKEGSFDSPEEAIRSAEQINKGYMFESEQPIKLNDSQLREIVAESVKKILKEEYDGNYLQLLKEEMHRLCELEQKVPNFLQPEIHSMVISMQAMLEEVQRNDEFGRE